MIYFPFFRKKSASKNFKPDLDFGIVGIVGDILPEPNGKLIDHVAHLSINLNFILAIPFQFRRLGEVGRIISNKGLIMEQL